MRLLVALVLMVVLISACMESGPDEIGGRKKGIFGLLKADRLFEKAKTLKNHWGRIFELFEYQN